MKRRTLSSSISIAMATGLCLLLLAGCSSNEPKAPASASLTRTLNMVDGHGVHYGTVELNPVGGGRVRDSDGRLIGEIMPVEMHTSYR